MAAAVKSEMDRQEYMEETAPRSRRAVKRPDYARLVAGGSADGPGQKRIQSLGTGKNRPKQQHCDATRSSSDETGRSPQTEDLKHGQKAGPTSKAELPEAVLRLLPQWPAEAKFKCSLCNAAFNSKKPFNQHLVQVHEWSEGGGNCPFCSERLSDPITLWAHLRSSHLEPALQNHDRCGTAKNSDGAAEMCNGCGLSFGNELHLEGHSGLHFADKMPSVGLQGIPVSFWCPYCHCVYASADAYARHYQRHELDERRQDMDMPLFAAPLGSDCLPSDSRDPLSDGLCGTEGGAQKICAGRAAMDHWGERTSAKKRPGNRKVKKRSINKASLREEHVSVKPEPSAPAIQVSVEDVRAGTSDKSTSCKRSRSKTSPVGGGRSSHRSAKRKEFMTNRDTAGRFQGHRDVKKTGNDSSSDYSDDSAGNSADERRGDNSDVPPPLIPICSGDEQEECAETVSFSKKREKRSLGANASTPDICNKKSRLLTWRPAAFVYSCMVCGMTFEDMIEGNLHVDREHKEELRRTPAMKRTRRF